jgi:ferredoxin
VQLRAVNAIGNGAASTAVSGTPATVPGVPTSLTATAGDQSASIACTAPSSNGGSAITGYKYSIDGGTTWNTASSATCPISITGLTNGTAYTVWLKATNAVGDSASYASTTVTPRALPTAPVITSITSGNQSLTVNCTDANGNGSAITNYEYTTDMGVTWRALSPVDNSCPLTITKTSANNTTLVNGTSYPVSIRGVNAAGSGANPSKQDATPMTLPGAPTSLRATAGDQSATIACTAPSSNGGSAITGYKYSIDGGTTWVTASELACPISITGLTNGTAYTVWLKATNSVGDSSSYGSTTVTPVALPSAPVLTTATPGNTTASIAWTAPVSTGGMPITSYQYSINGGTSWSTITGGGSPANPFTISSLSNGTAYSVTLRAVTSAGQGPASNALIVTPRTVPAAPTGFVVTPTDSSAVIDFVQGSNGGSAVTDVEWSIDGGTTWTSAGPGSTSVTVTNVDNGTAYTFKVRAKNVAGNGAIGSTTFTPRTVPAAPTGLSVNNANGSATISFTPGSNGGSPITNYKYSIDGGTTWRALSPADASGPITISGLTNGTTYSIAIRAVNAAGDGLASELAAAIPRAPGNGGGGNGGGSSSTPSPSPSSTRSSTPSASATPTPTPTPTATRTPSPTPTPSSSVQSTNVHVFDDLSPITQEIRDERDKCDKSVTREVCNQETDERTKEAVDSTKEKSKEYIASGEKKVDGDKKDVDEKEKKSKDDDEKATTSEKDANEKDKKADASEKKAKDDEKVVAEDKKQVKDDEKEVEGDKTKLVKDEKKESDDEKNKASAPVITTDKKEVEADKKELAKDEKKLEDDKKELEKDEKKSDEDHKTAEQDREQADDADEKAKKDREEADKSEKEAQDARDKLDKDEKELERAKEAEKRTNDLDGEHEKLSEADTKEQESEKEQRKTLENLYPDAEIKYVTLCHATSSEKNPYVNVTVEIDAWVKKGHGTHNADIVPGVSGLAPMNMVSGVTIFENNCLVPEQQSYLETATPTPFVEPSVTATPSASATPSAEPSATPSTEPSATPSSTPSAEPSSTPSDAPSQSPSATPSSEPSATPSTEPSSTPSASATPSDSPSPSDTPSDTPSPSDTPTGAPSDSPTPTPSEAVVPVTIPELIDEVTVYEDTSKEWHDTVIDNIILELEWIDEQANQEQPLPMPPVLVQGLAKEKELKKKLDVLGDKLMRDGNNIVDPKASPELISAGHMMFTRVSELRASDLRLARDRAGLADEFPWWILWVAALALALGAGLWIILAYRRKRVYIDFDACTACGLCYEKFPELFAKGPGGKAIIRQKSQHSDLLIIDIPDRKHHDALNDFVEQCKDGAIGFSRKVPREVKDKQKDLNA